jgi:iron(III) transport system substrate-binding protein
MLISRACGWLSGFVVLAGFISPLWAQETSWEQEWNRTLAAAKREGQLVVHGPSGNQEVFFREFEKKYPPIKLIYVVGRGQTIDRIMAERRAGKYLVDILVGGGGPIVDVLHRAGVLAPLKPMLVLPEVLDESKWWGRRHIYLDQERQYIFSFNGIVQTYFSYNTRIVNPKEFRSYWDFLNPKQKGKIVAVDPLIPGTDGAVRFLFHNPFLGPEFLRRFLYEMDLTVTRDTRQLMDWLAVGKFAIAALQSPDRSGLYEAKAQGLPVNSFDPNIFREGAPLSTSSGNVAVLDKAPHPNTAKIFINWLLSRGGQMAYQKILGDRDSLRMDILKDNVPSYVRRRDGIDYKLLTDPAYMDLEPVRTVVSEWRKSR